jgi:predicted PurR-regulated permease PerM
VLLIAASIFVVVLVLWQLIHLLLLVFGAVLVAVLLRTIANPVRDHTPLSENWSLAVALLAMALLIAGFAALLGAQLSAQATQLFERLPEVLDPLERWLGIDDIEQWVMERAETAFDEASLVTQIAGYSTSVAGIAVNLVLVLVAGVYLALKPSCYREGLLMLFPQRVREEASDTLEALGDGLRLWLLGQLLAMLMVGALTTAGLWLLGVPSALALGFIAGLLEFVPYVGPVLSAVPAIAVAAAEEPVTALWVGGLYVLVQQIEGAFITPLVQQRTVDLPPALTIFAIIAFGILLGPLGVLLATPLTVLFFVAVKKLWVRDTLEEETSLPGESSD